MSYRAFTHVALNVDDLQTAEQYYRDLFAMPVAFREVERPDGWYTLPTELDWAEAKAAGCVPGLSVLFRDSFALALEETPGAPGARLSHIGLLVDDQELAALHSRADELCCSLQQPHQRVLLLEDRYGVRWEITTRDEPIVSQSNGATRGRWLRPGE